MRPSFMECDKCIGKPHDKLCPSCRNNSDAIKRLIQHREKYDYYYGSLRLTFVAEEATDIDTVAILPWVLDNEGKLFAPVADVVQCTVKSEANRWSTMSLVTNILDKKAHLDELLARKAAQRVLQEEP